MLGFVHENCQLGHLGPELVGDLAPLDLRAVGVLLGEGGGDEGGDDAPALAAGMGQQVAGEVHAAALPCGAEDPGRGGLQALVVVGDHQLHAAQPAPGPRAQELGPEGLGLRRADRHAQDLAAALVVDGHSHGHRDRDDASGLAHLHVGGVEPQIGPVALQRSIEEAVDLIVDLAAQPGDLALGDARHPHRLNQIVDRAGRHALDVGLLDHRSQRLLGHPPRLQEAREVAPLPQLRDLQLDRAGPRLPGPVAVAVAVGDTIRRALAVSGAGQALDLQCHQPLGREADHLAKQIGIGALLQKRA